MTNGEKIQTILDIDKDCTEVYGKKGMMTFSVPQDWWNAEYKEPKTGHWEELGNYHFYNDGDIETTELRCSCCKEIVEWNIELPHKPHYCEGCGTKMETSKE